MYCDRFHNRVFVYVCSKRFLQRWKRLNVFISRDVDSRRIAISLDRSSGVVDDGSLRRRYQHTPCDLFDISLDELLESYHRSGCEYTTLVAKSVVGLCGFNTAIST
jgi:hypothetical protein